MKKYLYIFTLLLGVAYLTSCSEHEGTTVEGIIPYFKTAKVNVEVSPDNNGIFQVEVWRTNQIGAAEVEVALTLPKEMTADMFTLVSNKAVFKDGEFKTTVDVKFDLSKLSIPDVYNFELAITKEKPLASSLKPLTVSVSRKWVFDNTLGKGRFSSTFSFFSSVKNKEVDVLGINGINGVYSIKDAYVTGVPINFALINNDTEIVFNDQYTGGEHATYKSIYVALEDFEVEVDEVTKVKTVYLQLEFYVGAGSFGSFVETIVLP